MLNQLCNNLKRIKTTQKFAFLKKYVVSQYDYEFSSVSTWQEKFPNIDCSKLRIQYQRYINIKTAYGLKGLGNVSNITGYNLAREVEIRLS